MTFRRIMFAALTALGLLASASAFAGWSPNPAPVRGWMQDGTGAWVPIPSDSTDSGARAIPKPPPKLPPPPAPPVADGWVPYIVSVQGLSGKIGEWQCGTAKLVPHPVYGYYHSELRDDSCRQCYELARQSACGFSLSYMPELTEPPTKYHGLAISIAC